MDWQGWFTLGVLGVVMVGMVREIAGPDLIMMAGLFSLAAVGILTPGETFSGFANPAMATIGALFVVSAGLRETGAIEAVVRRVFGTARTELVGLVRMCPPLAAMSAFLNNAPIVAMMTPVVISWAHRNRLSPSHFLIPLSYATILGSLTTLIGTSVNLTVAGLMLDAEMPPMGFFELLPAGLPVCVAGLAFLILVAPRWIPARRDPGEEVGEHRREYTATMLVAPGCPHAHKTVQDAGLRQLPGLFLVEIERAGHMITPVGPDETIAVGDRLTFAGVVATIVDLQRTPGLVPVVEADDRVEPRPDHPLMEAVISRSSPLVGQSIRDSNFRTVYDAAVIAVHRNGERVGGKIGEIVLRPGDTLLLQAAQGFHRAHRNSPDFYLISEIPDTASGRRDRAWVALAILLGMIGVVLLGWLPISVASFVAAGSLVATRCINGPTARRSVDFSILVVIAAGLGIAVAMEKTGAARAVASILVGTAGELGPMATLAVVYFVTVGLAELLHHNAAAAIMFPIGVAAAAQANLDPRVFVMAIALGANCAFASPVTYQTHLIVYGPGGYRFTDFVRVGLPLDIVCGIVALAVLPRAFPF
ncbi:MAG: SLC13 family permease [Myxococcota bacterium]